MRSDPRASVAVLLGASLLAVMVQPAASQRFFEEITVTEIEIPVHVVRKGRAVEGLKREDFEVYFDGEPAEILGFEVVGRTTVTRLDPSAAVPGSMATPTTGKQPRRVLLFFDLLFAQRHDLQRALHGVREMTSRQLDPEDRVAVAYLGGSGAKILVGFTHDREELEIGFDFLEATLDARIADARAHLLRLRRHLEDEAPGASELASLSQRFGPTAALALGERPVPGANVSHLVRRIGSRSDDSIPQLDSARAVGFLPGDDPAFGSDPARTRLLPDSPLELSDRSAGSIEGSAVRLLAGEVERLAILLGDVPNPKEMLYLSEGFSASILEGFDQVREASNQARVLRYLKEMHEALLRGGWILHGVDVEGIPAAGQAGFGAHALFYIANETGGQLLENYNRVDHATRTLLRRTRVTYLLTIRPPDDLAADGRRHGIDVRLRNRERGTRIHHRPAYYAGRGRESLSPAERELQTIREWLGDEEHNPLAVAAHAGRVSEAERSDRARLMIEIPGVVITGEPASRRVPLEIQILVLDSRGSVQSTWAKAVVVDLAEMGPRLQDGGLRLFADLDVPPGPHRLRTLVRMPARSERSLLTIPVAQSWQDPASRARGEWLELSL